MKAFLLENKRFVLALSVMALVPLLCSSLVLVWIYQNQWIFELSGFKLFTIFTALSSLAIGLALVPSTVIAILAGYFLDLNGILSILISYTLALIIGIFYGRGILRVLKIRPFIEIPGYTKHVRSLSRHQLLFLINLRLSPALPFAMTNLVLASLPLKWSQYITGSIIGMLPRTTLFFLLGMQADQIWTFVKDPDPQGMLKLIPVALVVVSLIGLTFILKRVIREVKTSPTEL